MSDEKKEKTTPETPEEEKVDGDWKWDAAVPETKTDDISIDDLSFAAEKDDEPAEKKEEKTDEKSVEKADGAKKEPKKKNEEKKDNKKSEKNLKEKDNGACVICGKPRRNSGSDLYCADCVRKQTRTYLGIPQFIIAFVMVGFAVFGYITCVSNIQISTLLSKAEKFAEELRFGDASGAIVEYSEKVQTLDDATDNFVHFFNSDPNRTPVDFFKDGERSNRILFESFIENFRFDNEYVSAYINMVNAQYPNGLPKSKKYDKMRNTYDFCLEVRAYMNKIQPNWYNFMYTDEKTSKQMIKYDEAIAYLNSVKAETPAQKASDGFFRLVAETIAEKDSASCYKILDNIYKEIGEYGYMFDLIYLQIAWSYEDYDKCVEIGDRMYERNKNDIEGYYYAIKSNILQGKLNEADERCEKMIKENPENLDYFSVKAEVLRRMGDFAGSVEICRQGIAVGMDMQIYNQQAISYMLLDDKTNALEAAKTAYEMAVQVVQSNEVSLEIINTSALIAFLCGDSKTYDQIVALCKDSYGYELEDNVKQCIKGEITFEDIYMKGMGDV